MLPFLRLARPQSYWIPMAETEESDGQLGRDDV